MAAEPAAKLQLQARLFRSASGTFSDDVLGTAGPELINVVADKDPSTATLVVVKVTLAASAALRSEAPVRLRVTELAFRGRPARLLVDRTQPLGAAARGSTVHLGFWVQATGCRPLLLQARLPGAADAAATVPFACGE